MRYARLTLAAPLFAAALCLTAMTLCLVFVARALVARIEP
jgi:hypothetical protein